MTHARLYVRRVEEGDVPTQSHHLDDLMYGPPDADEHARIVDSAFGIEDVHRSGRLRPARGNRLAGMLASCRLVLGAFVGREADSAKGGDEAGDELLVGVLCLSPASEWHPPLVPSPHIRPDDLVLHSLASSVRGGGGRLVREACSLHPRVCLTVLRPDAPSSHLPDWLRPVFEARQERLASIYTHLDFEVVERRSEDDVYLWSRGDVSCTTRAAALARGMARMWADGA